MFGKNFKNKKNKELSCRVGSIPKQPSQIAAVPSRQEDGMDKEKILSRLRQSEDFQVTGSPGWNSSEQSLTLSVCYKNENYQIVLEPEPLSIPDLFTRQHKFTEADLQKMMEAESALCSTMTFGTNDLDSFHLQVKILVCAFPDLIGLVDFSAERILSGVWARMAAASAVPPAPSYLYGGQAVGSDEGSVWLHTHGLNRCGSIELEVLDSDGEYFGDHFTVMRTIAGNIISGNKLGREGAPFLIANLNGNRPMIGTWVHWDNACDRIQPELPGSRRYRESSHNANTGCLFLYLTPAAQDKHKLSPLSSLNQELRSNPLLMISNEETDRMCRLARERYPWFLRAVRENQLQGIIKFGMMVDDKYQNKENNNREHLWFEPKELFDDRVRCVLTQEPYYIQNLHEGQEVDVSLDQLTDWILYMEGEQITPDSVYLLEQAFGACNPID